IFAYLERNRRAAPVIQTILRTYGGITQYDTLVDLQLLTKKSGVSEQALITVMGQLYEDGLVQYEHVTSDLEIRFLVPREDDHTIYPFAKKIEDFNRIKRENLLSMLDYIKNKKVCRNKMIL